MAQQLAKFSPHLVEASELHRDLLSTTKNCWVWTEQHTKFSTSQTSRRSYQLHQSSRILMYINQPKYKVMAVNSMESVLCYLKK